MVGLVNLLSGFQLKLMTPALTPNFSRGLFSMCGRYSLTIHSIAHIPGDLMTRT